VRASEAPNAVCDGGPWSGWWFRASQIEDNRRAAARMGYDPMSYAGTALRYLPTEEVRPGVPQHGGKVPGPGRVWRWTTP
jgi:hypothetical protein